MRDVIAFLGGSVGFERFEGFVVRVFFYHEEGFLRLRTEGSGGGCICVCERVCV